MSGQIDSFNFETRERESAVFNDQNHSLPDGWDPLRLGMSISLSDGACFGQGTATQSLVAGGESIYFSGLADVNVDGFASYPYMLDGSGGALVDVKYQFRISSLQEIELYMDSAVGEFNEDDYQFLLTASSGDIVWGVTGVEDNGVATRAFVRRMTLQPGDYTVAARLQASSFLSGGFSSAGRTRAEFSISAVPEPSSAWLLGVGMGMFAWRAARSRPKPS